MELNTHHLVLLSAVLLLLAVAAVLLSQRRSSPRHLAYRFGPEHQRWSARRPVPQRTAGRSPSRRR